MVAAVQNMALKPPETLTTRMTGLDGDAALNSFGLRQA